MPPFNDQDWLPQNAVGIAIYRYIAFITRGANPEDNPHLRSKEDHLAADCHLRQKINAEIDSMLEEGLAPDAVSVGKRVGTRGLATVKTELQKRGFE